MQSKRKLKKLIKWGRVHSVLGDIGNNNGVMELMLKQAMTMHHKLIGFIGSFQIHMKSVISWVRIIYTRMLCII